MGLSINVKKTKSITISKQTTAPVCKFTVGKKKQIEHKTQFNYLGSYITSDGKSRMAEKNARQDEESITNEVVAQAHVENYALKLFLWADAEDRAARPNKNVVKAFYTSSILFDALNTFGELTDEIAHNQKYSKWKAAYIHNCLKNGEVPIPGPMNEEDDEEGIGGEGIGGEANSEASMPTPSQSTSSFPVDVHPQAPYPTHNLMPPVYGTHAPPSTPSERPSPPNESSIPTPVPRSTPASSTATTPSNQGELKEKDAKEKGSYCHDSGKLFHYRTCKYNSHCQHQT
ncbi:Vacuolar protein sorting-associated protein VTA1 [Nymphon striatum]|nr:Vacuolar protein sorting-associated protein VTA1 [Nymphon striatum]